MDETLRAMFDVFYGSAGRLEINVSREAIFMGEALRTTFLTAPQIVLRSMSHGGRYLWAKSSDRRLLRLRRSS